MKNLKIFIASGSELKEERKEAISVISHSNKIFPGLKIEQLIWETDIPSGSSENVRIRSEIQLLLEKADILLLIFYSKVGALTLEEIRLAVNNRKKLFIYFKTGFSPRNSEEYKRYGEVLELKETIEKENRFLYREYQTLWQFQNYFQQDLLSYLSLSYGEMKGEAALGGGEKYLTKLQARPIKIIGREADLGYMEQKLRGKGQPLLVQGIDGIGKTGLCKYYLYTHLDDYSNVAWVDYQKNLKESLVFQLNIPTAGENSLEEKFKKICSFLTNLDENTLLVVDNIENPNDPDLEFLTGLPFKVIANSTYRLERFSLYEIGFLHTRSCRQLFYHYYKDDNDREHVGKLMEMCAHHTLTVELLARTGQSAGLQVKQIYDQLKEKGFNLRGTFKEKAGSVWGDEKDKKRFFDHLLMISGLGNVTEEEKNILVNMSILPAVYIAKGELAEWLGLENLIGLERLTEMGWLKDEEFRVYMHPTIQEAVRYQTRPDPVKCRRLIKTLANKLDLKPGEKPVSKREFLGYGEMILKWLEGEDRELAQLANNLSLIYKELGHPESALEFQEKAIGIYEKVLKKNNPLLAISYNNLSLIYKDLGDLERAMQFQEKVLKIRETILDKDDPELAATYNKLSMIYNMLGHLDKALDFQNKAIKIREKIFAPLNGDLAESYNNLSMIQYSLGRYEEAMESQLKALRIRETILPASHPDLGESYINFALFLKSSGRLNEALEYSKKGVDIFYKVFPPKHLRLESAIQFMELNRDILEMQSKNNKR